MYDPAISADTLYGNEWIDYEQTYLKIPVAEDGVYQLTVADLVAAGMPSGVDAASLQLFHLGRAVPIHLSTDDILAASDRLEFYGAKNRNQLDRFLWQDPDEQLNPAYSLVSDTSAYYLSWQSQQTPVRLTTTTNDLSDAPAPQLSFLHTEALNFHSHYTKKYEKRAGLNVYRSKYDLGEGFASNLGGANPPMVFTPTHLAPGVAAVSANVRFATNVGSHQIQLTVNNEVLLDEVAPPGYQLLDYTVQVPVAGANPSFTLEVADVDASNTNRQAIASASLTYERVYDFAGAARFQWTVSDSPQPLYLEIAGVDLTAGTPVVYDLTNRTRTVATVENDLVKVLLPPGNGERRLVLQSGGAPTTARPVAFEDYRDVDASFVFLTHPLFINSTAGVLEEYAAFRAADFSTAIVDVEQLYEQFGYGVSRHPIAVRNFASWYKTRAAAAQHLLLVGKAREAFKVRDPASVQEEYGSLFFVPTMGFPGSDNLLVAYPGSKVPQLSIGRIAATSVAELEIYFDKLTGYEAAYDLPQTSADRAWMKRFIHLGGGNNTGEQTSIEFGLANMELEVEQNLVGANVVSFFKSTADAIQSSVSQAIFDEINAGAALITFFGHSSPGTFDYNIDNPDNYLNEGRYPLIFSFGCYSGDQYTTTKSLGERFVFYEQKGAIGFGASRGYGFITELSQYGRHFYQMLGTSHYGKSVGELLQANARHFDNHQSLGMLTLVEQFGFQGDPAVRLYPQEGTDYVVAPNSVRLQPDRISLQLDSVNVAFEVQNIGQTQPDSFNVQVAQELPDGSVRPLRTLRLAATDFSTEVALRVPTLERSSVGQNRLLIRLDTGEEIEELPGLAAEANNDYRNNDGQLGYPFLVADNTAVPVQPERYAIVNTTPTLQALTADAVAAPRAYVLELDTRGDFGSPDKLTTRITQGGGVIRWAPAVSWEAGRTYFWRISPDLTNGLSEYLWETSSFTYLPDSPTGWNQGRYEEWAQNDLQGLQIDSLTSQLDFATDLFDFRIKNKIFEPSDQPTGYVNNSRWSDFFRFNRPQTMTVVVLDAEGRFWFNTKPGEYGSVNSNAARIASYPFEAQLPARRDSLIRFLTEVVPDGHTVFVYNALRGPQYDLDVANWQADSLTLGGLNLFNVLEAQGAGSVRQLKAQMLPYVFGYVKGEGPIYERIAVDIDETFNMELQLDGSLPEGRMRSRLIGPAAAWERLEWSMAVAEPEDSLHISVYGLAANGQRTLLRDALTDATIDLSDVSAQQYPRLQLELFAHDDASRSLPDFNHWRVLFEGLPDVVYDAAAGYTFAADTLQEGQPVRFSSQVANLVPGAAMDSLLVSVALTGRDGNSRTETFRTAPVPGQASIPLTFELSTRGLEGAQRLTVELNADDDQAERTRTNNFLQETLYIRRDATNPSLDVTFDGVRILDGDLVSAEPLIRVTLADENEFLLLTDTNRIELLLTDPQGNTQRLALSDPSVTFEPAVAGQNRAVLTYQPTFTEDGLYRLAVQGTDASDNLSGDRNYEISFEVITESLISNVLNYPNPFTTSTRFVYTLTGSEPPADYRIRVMTASGRIVRELTEADLGPLRVGTHQTDGSWDGTDQFGDPLAKGVYLYRVVMRDAEGNTLDDYDNGTDAYFEKGFGKMVLLR